MSKNSVKPTKAQKKKNKKACLRNILAQPYPSYWPVVSEAHSSELIALLQSMKNDGQSFIQSKSADGRNDIIYGLSACIQQVKTGTIEMLFISADIKPRYAANQIILLTLFHNQQTQIFCVPNLNQELSKILPFPCFCFAIRANSGLNTKPLWEWGKLALSNSNSDRHEVLNHVQKLKAAKLTDSVKTSTNRLSSDIEMTETVAFEDLYLVQNKSGRAFTPRKNDSLSSLSISSNYMTINDNPSAVTSKKPQNPKIFDRTRNIFTSSTFKTKINANNLDDSNRENKTKLTLSVTQNKVTSNFKNLKIKRIFGNEKRKQNPKKKC